MIRNGDRPLPGEAGVTTFQLLMSACVVLIMCAMSVRPLSAFYNRLQLQNVAEAIKNILINARTRSISSPDRHCGVVYVLHAANSPYNDSIFAFLDTNPPNNIYDNVLDERYLSAYVIPRKLKITAAIPPGYPSLVIFRGDGSSTSSSKVALTLKNMKDTVDVLASTGRVKVIKK